MRSRMIDTAAGSGSDDDDTAADKADTDTSSPPEKRRRSEPTSRTSRSSNAARSGELRSSGRVKHRASDGNLPGLFNSSLPFCSFQVAHSSGAYFVNYDISMDSPSLMCITLRYLDVVSKQRNGRGCIRREVELILVYKQSAHR